MTFDLDDTICAIASASGGAARGIVRISGPQTKNVLSSVFRPADGQSLDSVESPSCIPGDVRLLRDLGNLPVTLLLWPSSRSYTRQPTGELHTLGSPPLLEAVVESLCTAGARLGRPGEFTLRAFLAGRIDLTQAEAVLGVIDAANDSQLRVALSQLAGGLADPLHALREDLLGLLAHLEAGLDFVDEDIEFISRRELCEQLDRSRQAVAAIARQMQSRQEGQELPRVVLVGPPNAGKSSLMNALLGRSAALVADQPGTTRDYLVGRLSCVGIDCQLIDTAGLDRGISHSAVGVAAQSATERQREQADLVLLCLDASENDAPLEPLLAAQKQILVWTKCDLLAEAQDHSPGICTSSVTGQGLSELQAAIADHIHRSPAAGDCVPSTAARSRDSLQRAAAALDQAHVAARSNEGDELVAASLREALDELGQVVGAVYTDDVLDRIFSRFCIGK